VVDKASGRQAVLKGNDQTACIRNVQNADNTTTMARWLEDHIVS